MLIQSFQRRPTFVRAVEFTEDNGGEIAAWLASEGCVVQHRTRNPDGRAVNYLDINCDYWETADHARPGEIIVHDPNQYGTAAFQYYSKDEFHLLFKTA